MTFADEVTADAPELWWDTREAVGTAQPDRSGNGHTGTVVGSPTAEAGGLRFDNSAEDQHIEESTAGFVPSLFSTFAFEAVVDLTDLTDGWLGGWSASVASDYLTLTLQQRWATLPNIGPLVSAFGPFFGDELGDGHNVPHGASAPPATSSLIHIIGEYDGTDLNVYLDGVLEATNNIPGLAAPLTEAGNKYHAGNDPFGFGSNGLNGLIRHSIFYDHDLGPTRAAAHAAAVSNDGPLTPPASDNPALTLTSDVGDLTPYGIEPAFSIQRGTSSPGLTGSVADAGTLGALLWNISRDLDPSNASGPFFPNLVPGVGVTAAATWNAVEYPLLTGGADGWPQTYPNDGTNQVVDFSATDLFRTLATASVITQCPPERTGARIQRILDLIDYPGPTDIAPGMSMVGAMSLSTVSALSHISDCALVEWGELGIDGAGTLYFRDRAAVITDARSSVSQATYVQSGGLNFKDVVRGSPAIVNEIVVTFGDTGQQVTVRDSASIAEPWGLRSLPLSLPFETRSQARGYARWLLTLFAYEIHTFTSVTLTPGNEPAGFDLWPEALGRKEGDLVTVTLDPWSAPYVLSEDPVTRLCHIRGVQIDFASRPYTTYFSLQDASWLDGLFIMDTSELDGPDVMGL